MTILNKCDRCGKINEGLGTGFLNCRKKKVKDVWNSHYVNVDMNSFHVCPECAKELEKSLEKLFSWIKIK